MMQLRLLLLTSLLLISCTLAPRQAEPKAPELPDAFTVPVSVDSLFPAKWWTSFGDTTLNRLVNRLMAGNYDLNLALARMDQLEALYKIQRARRLPSAVVSGSATSSEQNLNAFSPQAHSQTLKSDQYSTTLGLQFEIDLWGKYRDQHLAGLAQWKAANADLRTLYNTLIANLVQSWFALNLLTIQVNDLSRMTALQSDALASAEKSYSNGLIDFSTFTNQRSAWTSIQRQFEAAKQRQFALLTQLRLLTVDSNLESPEHPSLPESLTPMPPQLPSTILKGRSDIRAAFWNWEAAKRQVGVARADFFPSFSLTSTLGYQSRELSDLTSSVNWLQRLGGTGTLPVFNGGARWSAYQQSKAQFEMAELTYQKTVFQAFVDIETALSALKSAEDQYRMQKSLNEKELLAVTAKREQYRTGLLPAAAFRQAESGILQSDVLKWSALNDYLLTRIQVFRALGGYWIPDEELYPNE